MTFPKKDSYQTYGGDLVDKNPSKSFHKTGAVDLPAEDFNQCRASIAGATNTSFQAYIKYSSSLDKIIEYECGWDKIKSAPPVIREADVGIWEVEFPATIIDLRGKKQIVNMYAALGNPDLDNSTTMGQITTQKFSNNHFIIFVSYLGGQPTESIDLYDLFFF